MKRFKNRTAAICIASLLIVLGALGAGNYTNTLMDLRINSGSDGVVSITAYTQKPFTGQIQTEVEGGGVYNVILPETSSLIKTTPNTSGYSNISNLIVSTVPASNGNNGYTKIRILTKGNPTLKANTSLFLANKQNSTNMQTVPQKSSSYWDQHQQNTQNIQQTVPIQAKTASNTAAKTTAIKNTTTPISAKQAQNVVKTKKDSIYNTNEYSNTEKAWLFVLVSIVSVLVIFLYKLGKDKMAAVVGGQNDIELEDETQTSIRKKIKQIDKKYSTKPISKSSISDDFAIQESSYEEEKASESDTTEAEDEIIDLDSLFNQLSSEAVSKDSENNEIDDLASFLDDFAADEHSAEIIEPETVFDEEYFKKVLENEKIKFTAGDLRKLTELIQNEISEEFLNNKSDYISSTPKTEIVDSTKLIENILAEYAVKQNIFFTSDDVDTMRELMNVELDSDFVTDLRINSEKEKNKKAKNISNPLKKRKTAVLKVHDLLPDLSEELKKLGDKPIESNAKPQVVYYMEGYDVEKLSVDADLPDISKAVKEKDAWKYIPSEVVPRAVDGYKIKTLAVADKLPDLADVKAHPEKYKEKTRIKAIPDEKALLNSLKNVEFKPFYENKPADSNNTEKSPNKKENSVTELNKQINEKKIVSEKTDKNLKKEALKKTVTNSSHISVKKEEAKPVNNKNVQKTELLSEKNEIKTTDKPQSKKSVVSKIKEETKEPIAVNVAKTAQNKENNAANIQHNNDNKNEKIFTEKAEPNVGNSIETIIKAVEEKSIVTNKTDKILNVSKKSKIKIKENKTLTYQEIIDKNKVENKVESKNDKVNSAAEINNKIDNLKDKSIPSINTHNSENVKQNVSAKINAQKKTKKALEKSNELTVQHSSNIVKSVESKDITCLLMKNENGYNVIGKTQNGVKYLKHYDKLNSETIQIRVNEAKKDGTTQYLVRVSVHKFIIEVLDGNMEFIMDLC